jgi:hypothetical protein
VPQLRLCRSVLFPAAFAALFSAVIAYNRLEFTISKDEKWQASQEADKITAVMQQINSVLEGESVLAMLICYVDTCWEARSDTDVHIRLTSLDQMQCCRPGEA